MDLISRKFLRLIRKKIWISRCEKTIAWENTQGIGKKEKRRKKEKEETSSNGERNKEQRTLDKQEYQEGREEDTSNYPKEVVTATDWNIKSKVTEVVWNWVKEGKKWLGL